MIETIEDVKTMVYNSGIVDWKWGGDASLIGLVYFIWNMPANEIPGNVTDAIITDYLKSVGENPASYLKEQIKIY